MVWQNRECWKYYENCWTLLISDNKKFFLNARGVFIGNSKDEGGALHMGKGRSNNAGKSNQISMIHLISLNKANRQKEEEIKKDLSISRDPFTIDVLAQQIECSIK